MKRKKFKETRMMFFRKRLESKVLPFLIAALVVLTFFLRVYNTSDLSGGDDSEWAELAAYAIKNPALILYPAFPDEPIERQDMHLARWFTVLTYVTSITLFGYTKFAIVFPAALFSALSTLVLYLILKKLFRTGVALLSCFIFAVSPFHLAFSRIGLLDASLIFSSLTAFWFLIRGLEEKKMGMIYLSAVFWFINITTTDIRGAVPILAVLPCLYFYLVKGKPGIMNLLKNRSFHHFIISYFAILVVLFIYISLPIAWNDSGWLDTFKEVIYHSVGARDNTTYLSFSESVVQMGSILIFTPFLGLIFIPFLFGLGISLRKLSRFRYCFWIFYLAGILFFYAQGQYVPQRQTIFIPAIATFAAIGILESYVLFRDRKSLILLPLVLASSFSYVVFIFFMFSNMFLQKFSNSLSDGGIVNSTISIITEFWWLFVSFIFLFFMLVFFFSGRGRYFRTAKHIYILAIAAFLILNLLTVLFLVSTGIGIYKRTDATGLVGNYLRTHLNNEKYSCVADVHAKSFSFYTQRTCAFWVKVNTSWIDEQVKMGTLKYFILNTHHEYRTPGFGNVQPDGTLGPELGNSSPWLTNHYDKYSWLQKNAVEITGETGLKDSNEFKVYKLKVNE